MRNKSDKQVDRIQELFKTVSKFSDTSKHLRKLNLKMVKDRQALEVIEALTGEIDGQDVFLSVKKGRHSTINYIKKHTDEEDEDLSFFKFAALDDADISGECYHLICTMVSIINRTQVALCQIESERDILTQLLKSKE